MQDALLLLRPRTLKFFNMLSVIIAIITVVFDLVTKHFAVDRLIGNDSFVVIPKLLRFTYVENTGAAFGMLSDSRFVFMIMSVAIIALLGFVIFKYHGQNRLFDVCIGLILGGGVGNMIDRVRLGYVIDFIDFYAFDFWKYVFNIADSAVVVGCILAFVYVILDGRTARKSAQTSEEENKDE